MSKDIFPTELPDFDTLANALIEEGILTLSPSELHGVIAGHVAAGARFDPDTLLRMLADLTDVSAFKQEASKLGLLSVYQATLVQLQSDSLAVELLLPDDDQALGDRVDALGSWCSGFLAGFGMQVATKHLSDQVNEAIQDLAQIAQIEADSEEEPGDEANFMEVAEYVRMALVLVFLEYNQPDVDDSSDKPAVLH